MEVHTFWDSSNKQISKVIPLPIFHQVTLGEPQQRHSACGLDYLDWYTYNFYLSNNKVVHSSGIANFGIVVFD